MAASVDTALTIMDKASAMTDPTSAVTDTASNLGGICWDENDRNWVMCYELEQNGVIVDRHPGYLKACETHMNQPSIDESMALNIISNSSQAVASLYLIGCQMSQMSGFFINKDYFLTCAHFGPSSDTLKQMSEPGSKFARASVSRHPQSKNSDGLWLHNIYYDGPRDLALFRINASQDRQTIRPAFTINFNSLVAAENEDFSSRFKDQRVFTIGYNQQIPNNNAVYQQAFQDRSHALLEQLSLSDAAEYLQRLRPITAAPSFDKIFHPNRKTLTIGRLTEAIERPDGNPEWRHRITGWYGISGAPIACMNNENGPKMTIIGLFTNAAFPTPDNGMRPFRQEDIALIKEKLETSWSSA